ncbi:PREDICTED: glucose dehydrogenase [FAD, quinone]-like, partial [Ceratosolen solmsi marchali]|uniref:Glucose dehydrogenase [FAD, quinone]-like n=1 Tax=Ceratosolen solmsi marchali TaxID=326594 RepID=A0AAJ6YKF0_9HYME
MILLKFIYYIIYSIGVIVFMCYVDILYMYNFYQDWLFCDIKNNSEYDYLIVGAGSSGSVLATQLSKVKANVLLIEAGGTPINFFDIPVLAPLLLNTVYDWKYVTVPQKNACKGLNNNQSIWSAGKILGGSSRLNYMVYVQGHPDDYNPWLSDIKEPIVDRGGSLYVSNKNWYSKLSDAILQGVTELSYSLRNYNKVLPTDFMKPYLTIKNGERWSTDRLISESNDIKLKILTNSFVNKILFKSKKAVGVEFLRNNQIYRVFAKSGVILCAGTIGTPKLLMLSGIGPKQNLEKHNIKIVADLPVGKNLMDHIITGVDLVILNTSVALSIADIINPFSLLEYYLFKTGPWTSSGVDVIGTLHSQLQNNKTSVPDLQIMTFPVGLSQDNGVLLRKNLGISDKIFNEYFAPLVYKTAVTIAPVLLHPQSIGEIQLRSSDFHDNPIIDPNYLSEEEDVLKLVDGIEFIKRLINTKAMKELGAILYEKPFPGCENITFDTINYWKCYIKHLTFSTYHPIGTCRMGDVVDSKFRVYETKNLYVVDASVFPKLPSGNINAPVVMLSEKAAGLFIKDFTDGTKKTYKCYKSDV